MLTPPTAPPTQRPLGAAPAEAELTAPVQGSVLTEPDLRRRSRWRSHFALLWGGSAAAQLGSASSFLAAPMLTLWMTGSPVFAGWVTAAGLIPRYALELPVGHLVDRSDPRTVLIAAHAGRLLSYLVLPVPALVFDAPPTVLVAVLAGAAALHGFCELLFSTADVSAVRALVPRDRLTGAASTNEARSHGAQLGGRPLGGALFSTHAVLPFVLDFITALVALAAALRLPRIPRRRRRGRPRAFAALAGVPLVWRDRFLRSAMLACTVTNFLFQLLSLMMVAVTARQDVSPFLVGLMFAGAGLGGILGSLAAPLLMRRLSPRHMLVVGVWGWLAVTAPVAAVGADRPVLLVAALTACWAGIGFIGSQLNVAQAAYQAEHVPEAMLGRVTGASSFFTGIAVPLGAVCGGHLFAELGSRDVAALVACCIAALALALTASGWRRR